MQRVCKQAQAVTVFVQAKQTTRLFDQFVLGWWVIVNELLIEFVLSMKLIPN